MGFILNVVIITFVVTSVGGGLGYWVWLLTRAKKQTWIANVYQLGAGIRRPSKDSAIELNDLIPCATDVLEKIEGGPGRGDIYRLQRLKHLTPPVDPSVVENWGVGKKKVSVLLQKSGATLLKAGYDKVNGIKIYDPMPNDRINVIKNELAVRKDRLKQEKDILQAITPWIVAGICIIGLVAICYLMINGFVKISEHLKIGTENLNQMDERITKRALDLERLKQGTRVTPTNLGKQNVINLTEP